VVVADTAVEAVVMVAEVSTEVAWAVEASMAASPVAAFAEAVPVSRVEALEVDMAAATVATAMVEAMVMADMAMTVTDSPEVFWPVH
jgi:hypothetical protein